MKEFVLHYIWQNKLFVQHDLYTTDGQRIEVIDIGRPNAHAGPDFFNAKIKIGKTVWAGNIEIHNLSSEWNKHRHQQDRHYGNVILHVVKKADIPVFGFDGQSIPQLELIYSEEIENNYAALLSSTKWIACADKISMVPDIYIRTWKHALLAERLDWKTREIKSMLIANDYHWEAAFFLVLCRSFGFSVNNEAFYRLAKSIPWMVLQKSRESMALLEALFFGQSGLLDDTQCKDGYIAKLKQDHEFLKRKYGIQPIEASQWRLLRLRPDNFPCIRISQLVYLLFSRQKMFSYIIDNPEINLLTKMFAVAEASEYWLTHYMPGEEGSAKARKIGRDSIYGLIINGVIPMIFCYGELKQNQSFKEKALAMLDALPAENNYMIRKWKEVGMSVVSASDSQALIGLYKRYCEDKKCLRCSIGHKVLTKNIRI